MEKKKIIVTDIDWDAPKSVHLPKKISIDITDDNRYLLEDIEGYADELSDYISDTYGFCHNGFSVKVR